MKINQLILALSLTIGLTACGQGSKGASANNGSQSLGGELNEVEMEKIENDTAIAEEAMVEAQAALDNVLRSGPFAANGLQTQSFTGIAERLDVVLDQLYDKITLPVQAAHAAIAKARAQIAAQIAKLDPANPMHASAIAKLQQAMAKLDQVEGRLDGVYAQLASKIDVAIKGVDSLLAKLNGNPLLFLVAMEVQSIRDVIVEFRDKLANT